MGEQKHAGHLDLIDLVIRDVCEMPDRSSSDDDPEAIIFTYDELRSVLERRLEDASDHAAEVERLKGELERWKAAARKLSNDKQFLESDLERVRGEGATIACNLVLANEELTAARERLEALRKFEGTCACDFDLTPERWRAYQEWKLLDALTERAREEARAELARIEARAALTPTEDSDR